MREKIKYKILTFTRYFGDALFYPFFSLYLKEMGLIEDKIGFILSISPIVSILVYPIYTKICCNVRRTRNVLKIISTLEALVIAVIAFSSNFYLLSILAVLLSIFGTTHYGLMDTLITVFAKEDNSSYSIIRVYGSIAYVIATTIAGFIVNSITYKICFIIGAIMFIISSVLYHLLKPIDVLEEKNVKARYSDILKDKKLLIFIIFYVLLMGTTFSADHFLPLYLQTRGINEIKYGLLYSYFVLVEVVGIFILNKFFKRTNRELLLLIASIAYFLRIGVYYLNLSVPIVFVLTGLRGVTYSIILFTAFPYIVDMVGKVKGQLGILFTTMIYSVYLGIGDNIFGSIIKKSGYKVFYLVILFISLVVIGLAVIRYIINLKIKR